MPGNLHPLRAVSHRTVIAVLAGLLAAMTTPALAEGCGRIDLSLIPPLSENLHPVILHEVDGRLPAPLSSRVIRLSPGRHVLKLSEAIAARRFTEFENLRRSQLFRYERFKTLELDVQDDTTYRIGVRFYKDKRWPIHQQAYWEPVVWDTRPQPCN